MLDTVDFENAAMEIVEQGWAYLDCPTQCDPERVLDLAPAFFDRRQNDWRAWQARRSGEDENDVGVLVTSPEDKNHAGEAKDYKAHVMYSDDMAYLLDDQCGTDMYADPLDAEFFSLIEDLHISSQGISYGVLSAISQVTKLPVDLGAACRYAQDRCLPTSTRATRVMRYFKKGGKPHTDRCGFTSPHWQCRNGELFAVDRSGEERVVSAPEGKILLFPSLKMEIATKGLIKALPHGSYCEQTDQRLAVVTFEQLVTDPLLKDSTVAKNEGLEKYQVLAD